MGELLDYLLQNEADFRKARLPALYSDFTPQRTLNPDGFAANLSAWKRGLASALLAGHAPSKSPHRNHFSLELDDSLLRSLETKQLGQPLSLGTVLAEAVASGEMIPYKQFVNSRESIYHKSWSGLGWSAVRWGLRTAGLMGLPGSDGKMPKGKFVVVSNLDSGAKAFGKVSRDRTTRFESTFTAAAFRQSFEGTLLEGQVLSEEDFDVLLKFLSRDKGMVITDGKTVKIRQSQNLSEEDATITEEDAAIANIKETIENLTRHTDALNKRIDELNKAAQEAVQKKNRVAALAALKSKKLAESALVTRFATLNQLEEVAIKIEQASDNVQLVKVVHSSASALKSLNAQVGGAEKVDEVFDSLREQMAEVDEVNSIIAEAGPTATVDEAEVDEEFETMLAEARAKEEAMERAEREKQLEKEAEQTKKRLAELENPGAGTIVHGEQQHDQKTQNLPTPVTATAVDLERMSLDEEPIRLAAE